MNSNEIKIPIFSYGSNSLSQLKGRLQNLNLISYGAYVNGYKRIFCGHSNNWNGGIASLVEKKFMKTYGIVVYLDNHELSKLDNSYPNLYETVMDRISDIYVNIFEVIFSNYTTD